jgi:hypothetical protein
VAQAQHDDAFADAQRRLERFGDRAEFWRMPSLNAAPKIEDGALDFAYIDARHDYASVLEDLAAWFPKVRAGGIFAGHDYVNGQFPEGEFGVRSAVDEFFADTEFVVYDTYDEPEWATWIVAPAGRYEYAVSAVRAGLRLHRRVDRKVQHLRRTGRWH